MSGTSTAFSILWIVGARYCSTTGASTYLLQLMSLDHPLHWHLLLRHNKLLPLTRDQDTDF